MSRLLIKNGLLIDPRQGTHEVKDVSILDGRVAAVGLNLQPAPGQEVVEAPGLLVTPGLVDLHVHVYWGVSHYGIDADAHCLAKGVTTAVDAGSAGAQTWPGFRRYVIEVSETRLLAFLNISASGMLSEAVGELEDLRLLDKAAAVQVAEANRDVILGIKVRLSRNLVGNNGRAGLRLAREAADAVGMPMMIHPGDTPMPISEILGVMRAGDVLTHCYHGRADGILDEKDHVLPAVRQAIERGVHLDVGHGRGSFTFDVARKALAQGVRPGTISSDLHHYNVNGPVFDLATTMSKFLYLGLSLDEVVHMTTAAPARAAGREGLLGTPSVGAAGDVTLLRLQEGRFDFEDANGVKVPGTVRLVPVHTIRAGRVYRPGGKATHPGHGPRGGA